MQHIFHIATNADWQKRSADTYTPQGYVEEGFIHCSYAHQITGTADRFYRNRNDLLLLRIDRSKVGPEVIDEAVADSELMFPHIHGRLNLDAIVEQLAFSPGANGRFSWPEEIMPPVTGER